MKPIPRLEAGILKQVEKLVSWLLGRLQGEERRKASLPVIMAIIREELTQ